MKLISFPGVLENPCRHLLERRFFKLFISRFLTLYIPKYTLETQFVCSSRRDDIVKHIVLREKLRKITKAFTIVQAFCIPEVAINNALDIPRSIFFGGLLLY